MKKAKRIFTLLGTAAFMCLLFMATQASAATLTVTTATDTADGVCDADCSLRDAIVSAAPGDIIQFSPLFDTAQTITLQFGDLIITQDLTITGPGANLLTVDGNNLSRVFSVAGAGITVNISGLIVTGGNADLSTTNIGNGGGIVNSLATLNLSNVTIRNNTANLGGGLLNTDGTVNISNSNISNNTAAGVSAEGGGINNNANATLTLTNTTVSDNTALVGGGIINAATASADVVNATISNNTATLTVGVAGSGGVTNVLGGGFTVRNTIIAANTAPNNPGGAQDVDGAFVSQGNNLIGDGTGSTGFTDGVNNDQVGTTAAPIDPLLGPLQNNGGQTDTRALLTGSPAINAGNNCVAANPGCLTTPLVTDQRGTGFLRQSGVAVDIGAFEFQLAPTAASASIAGRVMAQRGRGISRAIVYLTDQNGVTRTARTNSFGYYHFDEIQTGESVVINVLHKRYQFAPQVLTVNEDLFNVNFTVWR